MTDGEFDTSKHERLRSPERLQMLRINEVVGRLIDQNTRHVIDVGAGTGVWSEAFLNAGMLDVTAVDSSATMIDQIRKLVPNAKHMQTQADTIRMANESAGLVFAAFVLHEVPDQLAALKEWKRLSRRTVAVMEWPFREEEIGPPPSRRMTQDQIIDLGLKAGLGDADIWETEDWLLYTWRIDHTQARSNR